MATPTGADASNVLSLRLNRPRRWSRALPPGRSSVDLKLDVPVPGFLSADILSPRPLRVMLPEGLVLDEPLHWRDFQRRVYALALFPVCAGRMVVRCIVGPRPRHPEHVDRECPSRNRARLLQLLEKGIPDRLEMVFTLHPGDLDGLIGLRFTPQQFWRDGLLWQCVWVRYAPTHSEPSCDRRPGEMEVLPLWRLEAVDWPGLVHEGPGEDRPDPHKRQIFLPAGGPDDFPRLRRPGEDARLEPFHEIIGRQRLRLETAAGTLEVERPLFEAVGRLAPKREFSVSPYPTFEEARERLPQPILPDVHAHWRKLHEAAWRMLFDLVRTPRPESGLPGPYIQTSPGFRYYQFVWDTSFTAMATAYGWTVIPPHDSLDLLYSRQFDGGYIHREYDVRDGLPVLYEPDFSPNPPLMAVAEWAIYRLNGNLQRLRKVYPALAEHHAWLRTHRRLPDGTYWTTGLANGLDNSPSLGEGYPCLTAQMAHHAEMLALMAAALGRRDEARQWQRERREIAQALNRRLWSDDLQFYSTSLKGGGHNPNKVVTGFWPLWAGVVPPERVEALARELKNPASFWRPHPVPSLAADSPHYHPEGRYWLGSTWVPTNFVVIQGFARAGRWDLAREVAARHLDMMWQTYERTGAIWENYCAEAPTPGSQSGPHYSWSAASPTAILYEVVIGLRPDAPARRLEWILPRSPGRWGVRRYALGPCRIALTADIRDDAVAIEAWTDFPFSLALKLPDGRSETIACANGRTHKEYPLRPHHG